MSYFSQVFALRELALRQTADHVHVDVESARTSQGSDMLSIREYHSIVESVIRRGIAMKCEIGPILIFNRIVGPLEIER